MRRAFGEISQVKSNTSWETIQHEFVNRLVLVFAIASIPALLLSFLRTFYFGWIPAIGVHIVVVVMCVTLAFFRNKVSDTIKINIVVLVLNVIGVIGMLNFGFIGASTIFFVVSNTIIAICGGRKPAYLYLLLTLIILICISTYHTNYQNELIDLRLYIHSFAAWALFTVTYLFLIGVSAVSMSTMHESIQKLLSELEQQNKEISALAETDVLTGLWNLRVVHDRLIYILEKRKRSSHAVYVLFLDLDGFKYVNDTYGHQVGDVALTVIASRLKSLLRSEDTLARVGGDEFLIIVEMDEPPMSIEVIASRIIDSVSQPFTYQGALIKLGVCIGIKKLVAHCHFDGTPSELISAADAAMYHVKHNGKNGFCFTDDDDKTVHKSMTSFD